MGKVAAAVSEKTNEVSEKTLEFRDAGLDSVFKSEAATPEQINQALDELRVRLPAIWGLDAVLRVDFDDDNAIYIDGRAGGLVEPCDASARLAVHPDEFRRIIKGVQNVRHAMLLTLARVAGDISAITRFCDRLAGHTRPNLVWDRASLPKPTTDHDQARQDLAKFGYCLIKDALSPEEVAALKTRLIDQAAAETDAGVATFDGLEGSDNPPTQKVWALQNKGQTFLDLLRNPIVEEFSTEVLGPYFTISHYLANIIGPGGEAQFLHQDQVGIRPLIMDFPVGLNMLWFLDDVTAKNGGTRVVPGSHQSHMGPENPFVSDETVAAEGPAGTVLLFDSRLWHGGGANSTTKKRYAIISYFYRDWMRQQINPWVTVHPDVFATFDEYLKILHGGRCTNAHGGREHQIEGEMVSIDPDKLIREMRPKTA